MKVNIEENLFDYVKENSRWFIVKLILKVQLRVPRVVWAGSSYGGFYVVPLKSMYNGKAFSFGIGSDITFDKYLMDKWGMKVYGFDPTPKSCNWVKQCCSDINSFNFYEYGISDEDGIKDFYLPRNPRDISGSLMKNANTGRKIQIPFKTMATIMQELGIDEIDILKLDIEGSELEVIPNILKSGLKFKQLCVEIHYRFWEKHKYLYLFKLIRLLNRENYYIVAVSASCEEITLLKRG